MALTRGFIRNAVTTPLDARLMNMASIVANVNGSPRTGVLGFDSSLVTPLATMRVAVAAAEFATSKGKADGVAIFTNNGVTNVDIAPAPPSNSRITSVWVKHNDDTTGDADALPIFGTTDGAAAAAPSAPAIPTGALELAQLRIYSGTTAANGGANTLTHTYRMTAARGGVVPFRTKSELNAWVTAQYGQRAYVISTYESFVFGESGWYRFAIMPKSTANWRVGTDWTKSADEADMSPSGFVTLRLNIARTGSTLAANAPIAQVPFGWGPAAAVGNLWFAGWLGSSLERFYYDSADRRIKCPIALPVGSSLALSPQWSASE